jgi:hypothetical protein
MQQRLTLLLIAVLIIIAMAVSNTFLKNNVHEWRHDGKCMECHSQHVVNGDRRENVKQGLLIPPPKSHTDQFRKYTHGRTQNFSYQRCSSCHLNNECKSCHNVLPESHTSDFIVPSGIGMERHIMLATINPSSCLTCHKSFVVQCTGCHTPAEVKPWEEWARRKESKNRVAQ